MSLFSRIFSRFLRYVLPHKVLYDLVRRTEHDFSRDKRHVGSMQKIFWEKQSRTWHARHDALRPNQDVLRAYHDALAEISAPERVLILGATPELRDLVATMFPYAQVTICDYSWKMIGAMTALCRIADSEREIWVKANWLEMPFPDKYFDVVLGDLVLLQFPPNKESELLCAVARVLNTKGIFVSRARVRDSEDDKFTMQEIIHKVWQICEREHLSDEESVSLLSRRINSALHYPKSRERDEKKLRNELSHEVKITENHKHKEILTRVQNELCGDTQKHSAVRTLWVDPTDSELSALFDVYFRHRRTGETKDSVSQARYPILTSRLLK